MGKTSKEKSDDSGERGRDFWRMTLNRRQPVMEDRKYAFAGTQEFHPW
jgi:hypothetical protein